LPYSKDPLPYASSKAPISLLFAVAREYSAEDILKWREIFSFHSQQAEVVDSIEVMEIHPPPPSGGSRNPYPGKNASRQ
jgi:hypothetical protein